MHKLIWMHVKFMIIYVYKNCRARTLKTFHSIIYSTIDFLLTFNEAWKKYFFFLSIFVFVIFFQLFFLIFLFIRVLPFVSLFTTAFFSSAFYYAIFFLVNLLIIYLKSLFVYLNSFSDIHYFCFPLLYFTLHFFYILLFKYYLFWI